MDVSGQHPCVCVKRKYVQLIFDNAEHIRSLFGLRVCEKTVQKQDVSKLGFSYLSLQPEQDDRIISALELSKVQSYVDSLCGTERDERASCGGEDSSYDSDYEAEDSQSHQDVSRTVSDTLGAEFAEYVSTPDPGYTARVEFGLKLGYTERLVQAALQKLGPNPEQNELLEELIKLGAQASRHQDPSHEGPDDLVECAPLDQVEDGTSLLRPVVIDGSNVAMSHGNKKVFSCQGIKLCVDWFRARGHKQITVFVPKWRKEASRPDNPITDQEILTELEKERSLVFTPSRLIGGKRMVCYDDRYILRLAAEEDGIVVSNDNYRDLAQESPDFRRVVEERILMYSFVNDRFMPPDDPLGRGGPTLDNFLRMQPRKGDPPPLCPYGKKCTYGNKCKFHHPERGPLPHKSVSERLAEQAQKHLQARGIHSRDSSPGGHLKGGKSLSLPLPSSSSQDQDSKLLGAVRKTPLSRTKSNVPSLSVPVLDCDGQGGQSNVSKSHSVENVACYPHVSAPGQSNYGLWVSGSTQYSTSPPVGLASHVAVASRLSDPETSDQGVNLHRKLQRQLTLNPACDPRLNRMYVGQQQRQAPPPSFAPMPSWEQQQLHQSVTRIASAPDSYRPWPPAAAPLPPGHMHRLSSTSDPQLNRCVPPTELIGPDPFDTGAGVWPPTTSAPPPSVVWPPQPQVPQFAEDVARRRLHYHLASIFPEEQVKKAMQFYPDETNPQKICAAILAMFPKP